MKNSLVQLLFIFTLSSALILQALCQGSSGNTTTTTYNVLNFRAIGDGSTDDTQVQLHQLFQVDIFGDYFSLLRIFVICFGTSLAPLIS